MHQQLEKQLKETGKVRAFILKGRQQGISTYIAARFYHKASRNKGISTFILCHESDTTAKLFKIVKRYHDNINPHLKPSTSNSNRKELVFSRLDSDYYVGTAGNKEVGRGGTPQLFHGSEVAFWANQDEIKKGVIQSVPDVKGSEIIHESTANGMDAMFYQGIKASLAGKSDYCTIFVPWFWQDEYTKDFSKDTTWTDEELEYKELHNISDNHLMWRRLKIAELGGIEHFRQEYPATIDEAFQTSGGGLIKAEHVIKARKNFRDKTIDSSESPLVMGVDPARDGDRTVIAFRRGRTFPKIYTYDTMNQMTLTGKIAAFIDKHQPVKCFIDVAHGHGTIDRLNELGYGNIVQGVHFGETPIEDDLYMNKRAEMWLNLADWFKGSVAIPDDEEIHADLTIVPDYILTSNGKKRLVSKDEIKKKLGFSPDIGDAMALTFAYPVNESRINMQVINESKGLRARQKRG